MRKKKTNKAISEVRRGLGLVFQFQNGQQRRFKAEVRRNRREQKNALTAFLCRSHYCRYSPEQQQQKKCTRWTIHYETLKFIKRKKKSFGSVWTHSCELLLNHALSTAKIVVGNNTGYFKWNQSQNVRTQENKKKVLFFFSCRKHKKKRKTTSKWGSLPWKSSEKSLASFSTNEPTTSVVKSTTSWGGGGGCTNRRPVRR